MTNSTPSCRRRAHVSWFVYTAANTKYPTVLNAGPANRRLCHSRSAASVVALIRSNSASAQTAKGTVNRIRAIRNRSSAKLSTRYHGKNTTTIANANGSSSGVSSYAMSTDSHGFCLVCLFQIVFVTVRHIKRGKALYAAEFRPRIRSILVTAYYCSSSSPSRLFSTRDAYFSRSAAMVRACSGVNRTRSA